MIKTAHMKIWALAISICCLYSSLSFAAKSYELVNGQNFYEVLKVDRDASEDSLKFAYIKAIKAVHPDAGGTADEAAVINNAFDVLSKERESYDLWLSEIQPAQKWSLTTESGRPANKQDLLIDVINAIAVASALDPYLPTDSASRAEFAFTGKTSILSRQRRSATPFDVNDLSLLLRQYSLSQSAYQRWDQNTLLALALGSIDIIKERAPLLAAYQDELHQIRSDLEMMIQIAHPESWWARHLDIIYLHLEGRSVLRPTWHIEVESAKAHIDCMDSLIHIQSRN